MPDIEKLTSLGFDKSDSIQEINILLNPSGGFFRDEWKEKLESTLREKNSQIWDLAQANKDPQYAIDTLNEVSEPILQRIELDIEQGSMKGILELVTIAKQSGILTTDKETELRMRSAEAIGKKMTNLITENDSEGQNKLYEYSRNSGLLDEPSLEIVDGYLADNIVDKLIQATDAVEVATVMTNSGFNIRAFLEINPKLTEITQNKMAEAIKTRLSGLDINQIRTKMYAIRATGLLTSFQVEELEDFFKK